VVQWFSGMLFYVVRAAIYQTNPVVFKLRREGNFNR
jgi:hypothetical protein